MRPFSVASVTATCVSISNRSLATAVVLDELLARDERESFTRLKDAAALLHRINELATSIQGLLQQCSPIAQALQAEIPRRLHAGEDCIAVMSKQLNRLPADTEPDDKVLRNYNLFLKRLTWAFEEYKVMLEEPTSQESTLASDDWKRRSARLDQATAYIMQRSDIFGVQDGGSLPAYPGSGASPASPPLLTAANLSPDYPPPVSPTSGSSDKGKGFFSSLSASLQAMTAAMRPKPEPFVIALCQAAMRGDHNQMAGLLQEGANIDGKNEEGLTALICAVNAERRATVQWLIQKGADISVKDSSGKPPLFRAAKTGDVELVKMMLLYGADPNARTTSGKPIFCELALTADIAVVTTLLDIGADINSIDLTGRNIFIQAINAQNFERVRLFVERGCDINSRDITGRSAITILVNSGNVEMVEYLLSKGADAKVRDINGQTALATAADRGNIDMVKLLLAHGADVNVNDHTSGLGIFVSVVKRGTLAMARLFLAHGADANMSFSNSYGKEPDTALLFAITNEKWELAELLLKHGANSNKADHNGRTPLLESMQRNNAKLVQLLLAHGGDVNMEGKITPAGFARLGGQRDMLKVLQEAGVPGVYVPPEQPVSTSRESSSRGPATSTGQAAASAEEEDDHEAPPDYNSIGHSTNNS